MRLHLTATAAAMLTMFAVGCGEADISSDTSFSTENDVPVLGNGTHDVANVEITVIGDASDGLDVPRDLEFSPVNPDELWVVNTNADSMTVFDNAGTAAQQSETYSGSGGQHFMARPSALAMSDTGFFATIHEEDRLTQGPNGTPPDFMGPTLWTSDTSEFEGGHASHYDMLHNTPNGMGIAWESGNRYWVFDGEHSSITLYDFNTDHGPGGADHSDGVVLRYAEGGVRRVEGVPSHMEFVSGTPYLLIADSGNNRIALLDVSTGTDAGPTYPNYDGTVQRRMSESYFGTFINGEDHGLQVPSGLAIHNNKIFVGDVATSTIYAFKFDGTLADYLPTGLEPGSLAGIDFDSDGNLYVADMRGERVLQIAPGVASPNL